MTPRILALACLFLIAACTEAEKPTGGGTANIPAAPTQDDKKGLVDKAKEAMGNFKQNAEAPLTKKSVSSLLAIANDLKAEAGAGAQGPMNLQAMVAKAKDIKAVADKHGLKPSELTGLLARVTTVLGAMNSGNVPENLRADAAVLEKHQKELQTLFAK
jgi:hypothetical protein